MWLFWHNEAYKMVCSCSLQSRQHITLERVVILSWFLKCYQSIRVTIPAGVCVHSRDPTNKNMGLITWGSESASHSQSWRLYWHNLALTKMDSVLSDLAHQCPLGSLGTQAAVLWLLYTSLFVGWMWKSRSQEPWRWMPDVPVNSLWSWSLWDDQDLHVHRRVWQQIHWQRSLSHFHLIQYGINR